METPNYKMVIITSLIAICLSALILILLESLWATAGWSSEFFDLLLFLSLLVTIVGGMVLPAVVLVLSRLCQKKYANDQPKTKMFALINATILGVALVIGVVWLFITIGFISEEYIGFYIGLIICIVGSIAMFVYGLILEIQYLLKAKPSK